MLIKTQPPRYRKISRPVRRQPRWRLFLLTCLPLSGLLLGLLVCGLMGLGTTLIWLTTSEENSGITQVRRLQPLQFLTLTPTLPATPVTDPAASESDPVEPTSAPPVATSSPTPVLSVTPPVVVEDNPTLPATAAPVALGGTPQPVAIDNSTPTPLPTSPLTSTPFASATPTPSPTLTSVAESDDNMAATATPTAVPIPESWKDYMDRSPYYDEDEGSDEGP